MARYGMSILLLALIFLPGLPLPAPAAEAEDGLAPGSDLHRVIDGRITPRSLAQVLKGQPTAPFTLPKLWIYDRQGRQLWFQQGFHPKTFLDSMEAVLASPAPETGAPSLASRLADFTTPEGEPLDALPPADLTVVKYWAEWCQPCHRQSELLEDFLARHPETVIHVLHVEADPSKIEDLGQMIGQGAAEGEPGASGGAPVRVIRGKLDEETREKLESGELTPEELEALLQEAGEGEGP